MRESKEQRNVQEFAVEEFVVDGSFSPLGHLLLVEGNEAVEKLEAGGGVLVEFDGEFVDERRPSARELEHPDGKEDHTSSDHRLGKLVEELRRVEESNLGDTLNEERELPESFGLLGGAQRLEFPGSVNALDILECKREDGGAVDVPLEHFENPLFSVPHFLCRVGVVTHVNHFEERSVSQVLELLRDPKASHSVQLKLAFCHIERLSKKSVQQIRSHEECVLGHVEIQLHRDQPVNHPFFWQYKI